MGWVRTHGMEEEFQSVRALLVRSEREAPLAHNWDTRRWEGRRYYSAEPGGNPGWHKGLHLWTGGTGDVLAAVHPEGDAWAIQVAIGARDLEESALALIEGFGGETEVEARENDPYRQTILERRGYRPTNQVGYVRRMDVPVHPPMPTLPPGYCMRPLDPDHDAGALADLLNAAFGRDFHGPEEYIRFTEQAPTFRRELDLGAFLDSGLLAAYAAVPYVEEARRGIFEPVCTHPDHQGRGLATRLMQAGLCRLAALGALDVIVGTGDMPAVTKNLSDHSINGVAPGEVNFHPGANGELATIRFTAPTANLYHLTGKYGAGDGGAVDALIYSGSNQLYSQYGTLVESFFDVWVTLEVGGAVDVMVGHPGSFYYDSTPIHLQVDPVPEPASMLALASGLAMLVRRRR